MESFGPKYFGSKIISLFNVVSWFTYIALCSNKFFTNDGIPFLNLAETNLTEGLDQNCSKFVGEHSTGNEGALTYCSIKEYAYSFNIYYVAVPFLLGQFLTSWILFRSSNDQGKLRSWTTITSWLLFASPMIFFLTYNGTVTFEFLLFQVWIFVNLMGFVLAKCNLTEVTD
ncbi:uncharacterized protein LOC118438237 [Folsomia candida]|uniref:uncharacterized protein LOC118438237 n=1 Tax=Folsomia candida TaxID=158441 RepID=UPI001604CFCC|nr:uncharacterized protein LOC118438237 [Folsomia candida]